MAYAKFYNSLKNIGIRPLNKGMIRDLPPTELPTGSFLRLQNYRVNKYGLSRRGGLTSIVGNNGQSYKTTYNEKLYDLIYYWANVDQPEMLLIGSEHLYRFNADGSTETVYPDLTDPETSYVTVASTNYLPELQTVDIEVTMDLDSSDSFTIGDDFYAVVSSVEYYLGTIVNKVRLTTSTKFTVQEPPESSGEVIPDYSAILPAAGDLIYIRKKFFNLPKMNTNFTILPPDNYNTEGSLIIADQSDRGLWEYSYGVFKTYDIESSINGNPTDTQYVSSARVVTYMGDRLFIGNTIEQGKNYGQRIRWSDPLNFSRFQPKNYVDLPYGKGELLNLVPLGSLLIAYYVDAIYVGRPSNLIGLPYVFEKFELGQSGLVSQHAVAQWNDAHVFVTQDNIYLLDSTAGLKILDCPVIDETLTRTSDLGLLDYVQIVHDTYRGDIVFLFPTITDNAISIKGAASRLWRFNYETQGWSYDEVNFKDDTKLNANYLYTSLLASKFYMTSSTWEEWMDGTDPITEPPPTQPDPVGEATLKAWMPLKDNGILPVDPDADVFDSTVTDSFWKRGSWENLKDETLKTYKVYPVVYLLNSKEPKQLITEEFKEIGYDYFNEYDPVTLDPVEYPIVSVLETPDYDFGLLNTRKTATRFSIKQYFNDLSELDDKTKVMNNQLFFKLYSSANMGFKWKRPQELKIHKNYNEGHADFRLTGSTLRFKLINDQKVPQFKISELALRAAVRGEQTIN